MKPTFGVENLLKIPRKSPVNLHGISKLPALASTTFDSSLMAYQGPRLGRRGRTGKPPLLRAKGRLPRHLGQRSPDRWGLGLRYVLGGQGNGSKRPVSELSGGHERRPELPRQCSGSLPAVWHAKPVALSVLMPVERLMSGSSHISG